MYSSRSLSSTALYSTSNALQLPFSRGIHSDTTERGQATQGFRGHKEKQHGSKVRTGRKWSAVRELHVAESCILVV